MGGELNILLILAMALLGTLSHWLKKWKERWDFAQVEGTAAPSFWCVVWRHPPEALISLTGTIALLAIGAAVGDLNATVAFLAGFTGESAARSLQARSGNA